MSESVLNPGDKLHIACRRLFEEDVRRHFVGEVIAAGEGLTELRGHTFLHDPNTNKYKRLPEARTRIFGLAQAGYTTNKLPIATDLDRIEYRVVDGHLVVTDNDAFVLPINEFGPRS